jgi:hypothetical protein
MSHFVWILPFTLWLFMADYYERNCAFCRACIPNISEEQRPALRTYTVNVSILLEQRCSFWRGSFYRFVQWTQNIWDAAPCMWPEGYCLDGLDRKLHESSRTTPPHPVRFTLPFSGGKILKKQESLFHFEDDCKQPVWMPDRTTKTSWYLDVQTSSKLFPTTLYWSRDWFCLFIYSFNDYLKNSPSSLS